MCQEALVPHSHMLPAGGSPRKAEPGRAGLTGLLSTPWLILHISLCNLHPRVVLSRKGAASTMCLLTQLLSHTLAAAMGSLLWQ